MRYLTDVFQMDLNKDNFSREILIKRKFIKNYLLIPKLEISESGRKRKKNKSCIYDIVHTILFQ